MIERPEAAVFGGSWNPVVRGMLRDRPLGQTTQPCDDTRPEPRFHRVEDIGRFSRNRSLGLISFFGHRSALHRTLLVGRK